MVAYTISNAPPRLGNTAERFSAKAISGRFKNGSFEPYSLPNRIDALGSHNAEGAPMKGRNRELWDKAEEERRRCRDWLLRFSPLGTTSGKAPYRLET